MTIIDFGFLRGRGEGVLGFGELGSNVAPSPLVWQETKGKNYVWLDGGDPWFKAHSLTLDLTTQPTSSQAFSLFKNPSPTSGFPWWSSIGTPRLHC